MILDCAHKNRVALGSLRKKHQTQSIVTTDCGLFSINNKGSLEKWLGRRGTLGFEPFDLTRTVQIKYVKGYTEF
jgi:hypothetical protein